MNQYSITIICTAACLLLTACPVMIRQVDTAKKLASQGNWQELSTMQITCSQGEEGCNQLHLLKGDACFRLVKQQSDQGSYLRCAAEELGLGIQWTPDWNAAEVAGKRGQYQENWCESLRLMRSEQTSTAAGKPYNDKLTECAHGLTGIAGHQPAGTYFLHNAELATIRSNLNTQESCQALKNLEQKERTAAAQASQTPYADLHQRLLHDITGFKSSFAGCR